MTSWAHALMPVMDFYLSIDDDHVPDLMSGMAGHPGGWYSPNQFPDGVSGHAYIIRFPNSSPDDIMAHALMPVMDFYLSIDYDHVPDLMSGRPDTRVGGVLQINFQMGCPDMLT